MNEPHRLHLERFAMLAGRIFVALIFLISGAQKFLALDATAGYIASKGLPIPYALALAAGAVELVMALLLVLGLYARAAALVLAAFLIPVTIIFHNPFGLADEMMKQQMIHLLKNLAIIGGLVVLSGVGAGALALDHKRLQRRRVRPTRERAEPSGDLAHHAR